MAAHGRARECAGERLDAHARAVRAGRILNRLVKDQTSLDSTVPSTVDSFSRYFMQLVGVLAVLAFAQPVVAAAAVVLLVPYVAVAKMYRPAARDLRRIKATTWVAARVRCSMARNRERAAAHARAAALPRSSPTSASGCPGCTCCALSKTAAAARVAAVRAVVRI